MFSVRLCSKCAACTSARAFLIFLSSMVFTTGLHPEPFPRGSTRECSLGARTERVGLPRVYCEGLHQRGVLHVPPTRRVQHVTPTRSVFHLPLPVVFSTFLYRGRSGNCFTKLLQKWVSPVHFHPQCFLRACTSCFLTGLCSESSARALRGSTHSVPSASRDVHVLSARLGRLIMPPRQ